MTYQDTNSGDRAEIILLPYTTRNYTIENLEGDNAYIICVEVVTLTAGGSVLQRGCERTETVVPAQTSNQWLLYILISAAAIVVVLIFLAACCMVQKKQGDQMSAMRAASVLNLHQAMADAESGSLVSGSTARTAGSSAKLPIDRALEKKLPPNLRTNAIMDHAIVGSNESLSSLSSKPLSKSQENLNVYTKEGSKERLFDKKIDPLGEQDVLDSDDIQASVATSSSLPSLSSSYTKPTGAKKAIASRQKQQNS